MVVDSWFGHAVSEESQSQSAFLLPEDLELEDFDESDEYLETTLLDSDPEQQPLPAPLERKPPKLLPTSQFDSPLPLRHQRSILKINPQHGTPPSGPPALQPASNKRPLPKLVKASPLPHLRTFQDLTGSSLLIHQIPFHIQVPSFSLTRQFLDGDPPSPQEENSGGSTGGEGKKKKKKAQAPSVGSMSPSGTIPFPHRINKNNNISTANLNDPGDPNSPFICPLCSKAYVHLRSLKDHMKAHRGLTRCPACGKSFSKVANMRAHFAVQHATKCEEDGIDYLADFGEA